MGAPLRLLQVLPDTDPADPQLTALDLHSAWVALGVEVRTLALAPGPVGGLESLVPTLAPGRRSIAAHTQLRREARWADVVLLHGEGVAMVAALAWPRTATPVVLSLPSGFDRWATSAIPSRLRRFAHRVAAVVVQDPDTGSALADRLDIPVPVTVIPNVIAPPPPAVDVEERRALRQRLNLPDTSMVVRWVDVSGPSGRSDPDAEARMVVEACRAAGVPLVGVADGPGSRIGGVDHTGPAGGAADVVVSPGSGRSGPARALLTAIASGAAVVAPGHGALGGLVDDSTGSRCELSASSISAALATLADGHRRANAAEAASDRVRSRFTTDVVAGRWIDVAAAAAAPRP